jgi:hypothetical protein
MGFNGIQIDRPAAFLRRIFSLKGGDQVTVEKHVQPVCIMEDFTLPELRPQGGINTWHRSIDIGLVAGQAPFFQIRAPLNGGRLFVIESLCISAPTLAGLWRYGVGSLNGGGAPTVAFSRYGSLVIPSVTDPFVETGTAAAPVAPSGYSHQLSAAGTAFLNGAPFPFMMSGRNNVGFVVTGVTLASAVTISVAGYDRLLLDSEL